MNTALCVRSKNSHNIIKDFIQHYINLGIDKIILFDNLSDVPYRKYLSGYHEDIVEIYDDENVLNNQNNIYSQCIEKLKSTYTWLLLFDDDEFIYLHKHNSIKVG